MTPLCIGEGMGQKVNEQRLQLSHTKAQDGALSRAVGHPGKRERCPSPHPRGDVTEALFRNCMGTVT